MGSKGRVGSRGRRHWGSKGKEGQMVYGCRCFWFCCFVFSLNTVNHSMFRRLGTELDLWYTNRWSKRRRDYRNLQFQLFALLNICKTSLKHKRKIRIILTEVDYIDICKHVLWLHIHLEVKLWECRVRGVDLGFCTCQSNVLPCSITFMKQTKSLLKNCIVGKIV